jgi:hypothetical protein
MVRLLLIVTVAFAAVWAGWWVVGSRAKSLLIESWAEEMRAEGWRIAWEERRLRGFPSRFDTTFEGLSLADPAGAYGWEAPLLQLLSLSYRPDSVIAVFPDEQRVSLPGGAWRIASDDMRASATVAPGRRIELRRATLVGEDLRWSGPASGALEAGQIAIRRAAGADAEVAPDGEPGGETRDGDAAYDFAAFAERLALPPGTVPPGLETIERADLDATLGFASPLALADGRLPPLERIELRTATVAWAGAVLRLSGELEVDGRGRPEGALALRAEGWEALLPALAGILPEGQIAALEAFLGGMAGEDGTVETTIDLRDGRMSLGLLPLGPVPLLR